MGAKPGQTVSFPGTLLSEPVEIRASLSRKVAEWLEDGVSTDRGAELKRRLGPATPTLGD